MLADALALRTSRTSWRPRSLSRSRAAISSPLPSAAVPNPAITLTG